MLAPVVGLKFHYDALVERLTDGCDVGRKEKDKHILILEATKAAIIGNLVDFVVRHCVAAEIIHEQQNISIFSSSNAICKLLNYLDEYFSVHPRLFAVIIVDAVGVVGAHGFSKRSRTGCRSN